MGRGTLAGLRVCPCAMATERPFGLCLMVPCRDSASLLPPASSSSPLSPSPPIPLSPPCSAPEDSCSYTKRPIEPRSDLRKHKHSFMLVLQRHASGSGSELRVLVVSKHLKYATDRLTAELVNVTLYISTRNMLSRQDKMIRRQWCLQKCVIGGPGYGTGWPPGGATVHWKFLLGKKVFIFSSLIFDTKNL